MLCAGFRKDRARHNFARVEPGVLRLQPKLKSSSKPQLTDLFLFVLAVQGNQPGKLFPPVVVPSLKPCEEFPLGT